MEIDTVKVRFTKYITETDKAYKLSYKYTPVWIAKKVCWDLMVAGNDQHAWATIPAWKFKEITGNDINELFQEYGTKGLKEMFDCQIGRTIEKHTPEKVEPKSDNTIKRLKK